MGDPLAPLRVQHTLGIDDDAKSQEWTRQRFVWVPDAEAGFVAGKIQKEAGEKSTVERSDGQVVTLPTGDLQKMNPPKFDKAEDMAVLTHLNEASVLHNLRDRYLADRIYTYSGLFCVVVNPYKKLPIYSDEVIECYKGSKRDDAPPHVFALTDQAYRDMMQDREDQSILCTGESGAGKTENTKKVIQYLANVAAGGSMRKKGKEAQAEAARRRRSTVGLMVKASASLEKGELEHQLLQANPILETFGNAATVKNDNSSRFGKFIRIHFDASGYIVGASVDTYLLEKSRIVRQNPKERTFHAFYQLLKGAPSDLKSEFSLQAVETYKYLSNGYVELPDDDDSVQFLETNEAFKIMGLSDGEIKDVWKTIAAILAFGQLEWVAARGSEQCNLKSDAVAQVAAGLLGVNASELVKAIRTPKLKNNLGIKSQTPEQAASAVEAMCKATYEKLFLWIVNRINQSLDRTKGRGGKQFIGILDIAGFEIFEVNSFEQLLINFTNEKLQQLFNHRMFILEQEEYKKEGIQWDFIDFGLDLQGTIDLIENKMGVIELIDEATIFPSGNEKALSEKLQAQLGKNVHFVVHNLKMKGDFAIKHYAGEVPYDTREWITKNKDPINEGVEELLKESGFPFMKMLWTEMITSRVRGKVGQFRTSAQLYREQLKDLMTTLNSTTPHFVRCIIPNHKKRGGEIDAPLVLHQLRCNGVLEGIRIVRQGYPNRILFLDFKQRYQVLTPGAAPKGYTEAKGVVEKMLQLLLDPSDYRVGHTKVFFKAGVLARLEEQRDQKLSSMIIGLQAYCRGHLARKAFKFHVGDHQAVAIIQRNIRIYLKLRDWKWWKLYCRIKPMLKDLSERINARNYQQEIADLKAKLEKELEDKKALEEKIEALQRELANTKEALELERESVKDLEGSNYSLQGEVKELQKLLEDSEEQFNQELDRSARLVKENKEQQLEIMSLKDDLSAQNADQARTQRLEQEKATLTTKIQELEQLLLEAEANSSRLSSEIKAASLQKEEVETLRIKAEKAKTKAENELADLQRDNETLRADAAAQKKNAKKFDSALAEERSKITLLEQERDTALAEVRKQQTVVLKMKEEMTTVREQFETADSQRKRAVAELQEHLGAPDPNSKNSAALEAQIRELKAKLDEVNEECDENYVELSKAKQEKERLQLEVHKLRSDLENKDIGEEDSNRSRLQKQVKELQDELDEERRSRAKLANSVKKFELDLKAAQENLDEEARLRQKTDREKKKLEKKLSLITEEYETQIKTSGGGGDSEKLKAKNRELKRKLEETEDSLSAANNGRRRAERDLEEQAGLVETLEKELRELRQKLRKARLDTAASADPSLSPRSHRKNRDDLSTTSVERFSDMNVDDDGTVTKVTRTVTRKTETHYDEEDDEA